MRIKQSTQEDVSVVLKFLCMIFTSNTEILLVGEILEREVSLIAKNGFLIEVPSCVKFQSLNVTNHNFFSVSETAILYVCRSRSRSFRKSHLK